MDLNITDNRIDISLDWKFKLGDEPKAWYKGFDDSSWRTVDIPHDWSVEHPFSKTHSSGTGYLPGGTGYYRKSFFLPEDCRGKRVYITFDGIYNNSMVWCNSYYLGKRPNGYTEINYDITDFVCFGKKENVITVKVAHHDVADSRWFTGSGIYRKVTVTVKNNISIPNHGIFISVPNGSVGQATLALETQVQNSTNQNAEVLVRHTLYDADCSIAFTEGRVSVQGNGQSLNKQKLIVQKPKLWSTETPNLYSCMTELIVDGEVIDREKTITGIRIFLFCPNRGFFLNGTNMKIKGVCIHHDAGCLGAAVRKKVWQRRLAALKAMGCNAIRMSHNPHMPELYDLCDELGFLVIDEAFDEWEGAKNKWTQGHNVYPPAHYGYYEDFPQWHEKDLTALVLRDRNHPSVIMWSIGNEVDYPNDPYCHHLFSNVTGNNDKNKPMSERLYDPNRPTAERLVPIARKLTAIVKRVDPTRPVTAALALPELSNIIGLADCVDIVGYNYKEHLYEDDHRKYPEKVILGSENTKGLQEWRAVADYKYISGQFLWTGIDFLGETQGWPSHGSHSGLLDLAGFKKPVYYFRQSLWSDTPMVKLFSCLNGENSEMVLCSMDVKPVWSYEDGQPITVICFTNCPETELFINGRSLGVKKVSESKDGYLLWTVPYEQGEVTAVSTDCEGARHLSILRTSLEPAEIRLTAEEDQLVSDGRDIAHVLAQIVDKKGNLVYTAEHEIHITVEGAGSLLGLENGNLEDTTPYSSQSRKVYNGRLLVYVKAGKQQGLMKVVAKAEGFQTAEIILPCV